MSPVLGISKSQRLRRPWPWSPTCYPMQATEADLSFSKLSAWNPKKGFLKDLSYPLAKAFFKRFLFFCQGLVLRGSYPFVQAFFKEILSFRQGLFKRFLSFCQGLVKICWGGPILLSRPFFKGFLSFCQGLFLRGSYPFVKALFKGFLSFCPGLV